MTIAKNIKKLRQAQNLTQDQLAERLFVTRQTVSNWERGTSNPDLDQLEAIAAALGVDTMTLLYGPQSAGGPARPGRGRIILAIALTAAAILFGVIDIHFLTPWLRAQYMRAYILEGYFFFTLLIRPLYVMMGVAGAAMLASIRWDISVKKRGKRICFVVFILLLLLLSLSPVVIALKEHVPYWLYQIYFEIWVVHDPSKIQCFIAVLAGLALFFAVNPPWRKTKQPNE